MKKLRKIHLGIVLIIFMLCGIHAEAAEYQLKISLGKDGGRIALNLYQIAEAAGSTYECLPVYQGADVRLTSLKTAKETKNAAQTLADYIKKNQCSPSKSVETGSDGKVTAAVGAGAWLLTKESEEGEMAPVLILIPADYEGETLDIAPKFSKIKAENSGSSTTTSTAQDGKGAGTGDDALTVVWILAMAAAVLGMILAVLSRRRRK